MGIYTEAIQKLYVAYFSRPADAAGLTYWEGVVTAAKGSTAAVSAAFAASAEYKAAFAGMDAYHVVDQVYMNLFGRHAEPAGLAFWGQNLIAGKLTIDAVVTAVASGAQGSDLVAYNSKVAAATAFTAALDTSAEILGYSGPAANALAANFIAGVTSVATLDAAIAKANLDAVVLAVTTPQPIGTTFTLTTGVDTFVGTNANDTFNTTGATLTTFDNINGGGGNDVMNIVDAVADGVLVLDGSTSTVAGIETVSILSVDGVNANTSTFDGTTKLNITSKATAAGVSATVAGTTDVFIDSANTLTAAATGVTVSGGKSVIVTSTATGGDVSVSGAALTNVSTNGGGDITVDNLTGGTLNTVSVFATTGTTVNLSGKALTNVNLSNIAGPNTVTVNNATAGHVLNLKLSAVGTAAAVTIADAAATGATIDTVTKSNVALSGAALTTATLIGAGALALNTAGAAALTTIAGADAGALTLTGLTSKVSSVTTGSGNDSLTLTTATVKDKTNATVSTGAGNDTITLATSGDGIVTVAAGDGNDSVHVTARGTGALNIDLGAGTDKLTTAGVTINAGDTVNAGAGIDTLTLNLVGSANIGAFTGFELFDAVNLAGALDVDILASKNSVTEIVASGDVGVGAELINVGAGVGFRALGDMAASVLTLNQKAAGAITVTADMDETGTADLGADAMTASVSLTNATSANLVFDTAYLASIAGETAAGDNVTTLNVTAGAATSATVVSGGTLSVNVLNYTDTNGKLASLTVSGAQGLTVAGATLNVAMLDGSAMTGALTVSTDVLSNGGMIKLGSGADRVTVDVASSITTAPEQISGMEKTLAVAVNADGTVATGAAAVAAIADADTIGLAGGTVANASAVTTAAGAASVNAKGVLTFSGAGPATLDEAFLIADAAAETIGEVLVFEYIGNSYVFMQQGAVDVAVKLVGLTGITNIAEVGATDTFFIV